MHIRHQRFEKNLRAKKKYWLTRIKEKRILVNKQSRDVRLLSVGHAEPVVRASARSARGGIHPTVAIRDARVALVVVCDVKPRVNNAV